MEAVLHSWSALASHFIGDLFDQAKPFIDNNYDGLDPLVRFVSAQLYIDCHLSSESALILLREQKEWDADLVSRSVMEGSLKLTYMLTGDASQVARKADEYWNVLPSFSSIRHSERSRRFLAEVDNPDDLEWKPFKDLLLPDAEVERIRGEHPRQSRQSLEEQWSFTGICSNFAKSDQPGLRKLVHLAHGYGMSSHLLHKDGDGVGMVWERYQRATDLLEATKLGHSARVVSDVCSFASLRLWSILKVCGQPTTGIKEIEEKYVENLFNELRKASDGFTEVADSTRA